LVGIDVARVAALPGGGIFTRNLVDGGPLEPGNNDQVLIPAAAAEEFGKAVGDDVYILDRKLEVVGIFRVGSLMLDRGFIVPIDLVRQLREMPPTQVSAFYVEPAEGAPIDDVARALGA